MTDNRKTDNRYHITMKKITVISYPISVVGQGKEKKDEKA